MCREGYKTSTSPDVLPNDVMTRILQVCWNPVMLVFYICASCTILIIYATLENAMHKSSVLGGLNENAQLVSNEAFRIVFVWLLNFIATTLSTSLVDFLCEVVYRDMPYYNDSRRPKLATTARIKFRAEYLVNTFMLLFLAQILRVTHYSPEMLGIFAQPENALPTFWDLVQALRPGTGSIIGDWFASFCLIQTALVLSDFMYWSWHLTQHKFKILYRQSGHSYHHQFRYPSGSCGPWLSMIDILFSGAAAFVFPIFVTMALAELTGLFPFKFMWSTVLLFYIHEMNHFDHCGKQVPVWSGCPMCPPLGFALNLHESIPCHESHHNFGSVGFGLLGLADKLGGTVQYPADHPKHITSKHCQPKDE